LKRGEIKIYTNAISARNVAQVLLVLDKGKELKSSDSLIKISISFSKSSPNKKEDSNINLN